MAEEKKILKGKVKEIVDANYTDQNGNLYFRIRFEENPEVEGMIAIRPGASLKVGDEMFYSAETRRNKNNKEYIRFHREKDPSAPEYNGGKKGGGYEREDPYIKVIAMCLSYANELAVNGKIDPSKVLAVANDYTIWVWAQIDERKK
jgi:hypothetical protein